MELPVRVTLEDDYDVCICRPSKFGNPYSHKEGTLAKYKTKTKAECLEMFKKHLETDEQLQKDVEELRGKRIACFCKLNERCHGDIIIEFLSRDKRIEEIFGIDI